MARGLIQPPVQPVQNLPRNIYRAALDDAVHTPQIPDQGSVSELEGRSVFGRCGASAVQIEKGLETAEPGWLVERPLASDRISGARPMLR